MAWRDWREVRWLDRIDERSLGRTRWGVGSVHRLGQAQAYTGERVLAAAAFEPNLPMAAGGVWGIYVGAWRWLEKVKGRALAENFVLAVTPGHLLALRATSWTGKRVTRGIGTWNRADLIVTSVGSEGEDRHSWAIRVGNSRLGRWFEAKPTYRSGGAEEVRRL